MTKHLVRLQQTVRGDQGQGALEYIGILAVVALVIGLALTAFTDAGPAITEGVGTLIESVFTAGG